MLRDIVMGANGLFLDFFAAFVGPLERELSTRSTHRAGRAHGIADLAAYTTRINATNFALANDDGSRRRLRARRRGAGGRVALGKTPTCVYLALQYGVFAANYPLTEDDLEAGKLPARLEPYRASSTRSPSSRSGCSRSATSAAPTAATPRAQQVQYELRAAEAHVCALCDSVARHHRVLDRGDRQPHSQHYRHRAAAAALERRSVRVADCGTAHALCARDRQCRTELASGARANDAQFARCRLAAAALRAL